MRASSAKMACPLVQTTDHQHLVASPQQALQDCGISKMDVCQLARPNWSWTKQLPRRASLRLATPCALMPNQAVANLRWLALSTTATSVLQVAPHLLCSTNQQHLSFCSSLVLSMHSWCKVMELSVTSNLLLQSTQRYRLPTNLRPSLVHRSLKRHKTK